MQINRFWALFSKEFFNIVLTLPVESYRAIYEQFRVKNPKLFPPLNVAMICIQPPVWSSGCIPGKKICEDHENIN
jgi:hypothetical protein